MNQTGLWARGRSSLSFRLRWQFRLAIGAHYQQRLARSNQFVFPKGKPPGDFSLMYLTGRAQSGMLEQSLLSVAQNWTALPRLTLISDGTISSEELRKYLDWWPQDVTVTSWQACAEQARRKGRTDLARLAEINVLGRKLCAILELAEEANILFCDTDILWFTGPPALLQLPASGPALQLAEDFQAMYDPELIGPADLRAMETAPWLNTGVCYARGDIYTAAGLDEPIQQAAERPSYFSEQTILALAGKRLHAPSWPRSEIYLSLDDAIRWPRPSFAGQSWLARHYPGDVRHWFWVDAYFLKKARRNEAQS